ncbi:DNA translocase FtsK [Saccharopolyspora pogona]|uniref:DNA translocase FtsK n=1 Tax=Saccharopolyspora pogona TaxID=333966 RepID=UPI001686BBE4|nr:DNA translocase FtsK [Saccharopolyspora pogona]
MSDVEKELQQRWDHVRGAHFDVDLPTRTELTADMVAAGARLVIWTGFGSTSMLQRRLRISFTLARQVMDELVRYEVVGAQDDSSRSNPVLYQQDAAHEVFTWMTGLWRPAE